MLLVAAPASDLTAVDRLTHLHEARGAHGALGAMEVEAGILPVEPAMSEHAPRDALEVIHQILITDVHQDAGRQHLMPMLHHALVASVVLAELGEVVGE